MIDKVEKFLRENGFYAPPLPSFSDEATRSKQAYSIPYLQGLVRNTPWLSPVLHEKDQGRRDIVLCTPEIFSDDEKLRDDICTVCRNLWARGFKVYIQDPYGAELIPFSGDDQGILKGFSDNPRALQKFLDYKKLDLSRFCPLTHYRANRLSQLIMNNESPYRVDLDTDFFMSLKSISISIPAFLQTADVHLLESLTITGELLNQTSRRNFKNLKNIKIHGLPDAEQLNVLLDHALGLNVEINLNESETPEQLENFFSRLSVSSLRNIKGMSICHNEDTLEDFLDILHKYVPDLESLTLETVSKGSTIIDLSRFISLKNIVVCDSSTIRLTLPQNVVTVSVKCDKLVLFECAGIPSLLDVLTINSGMLKKLPEFICLAPQLRHLYCEECASLEDGQLPSSLSELGLLNCPRVNGPDICDSLPQLLRNGNLKILDITCPNSGLLESTFFVSDEESPFNHIEALGLWINGELYKCGTGKQESNEEALSEIRRIIDSTPPPSCGRNISADFYEKKGTPTLIINTKIYDLTTGKEKDPSSYRCDVYSEFDLDENYDLSIVRPKLMGDPNSPEKFVSHGVCTHKVKHLCSFRAGVKTTLPMLGPYDTLGEPDELRKFGEVDFDPEKSCYFLIPNKTQSAMVEYEFLHEDQDKIDHAIKPEQCLLPELFSQCIDHLIIACDAADEDIPEEYVEVLGEDIPEKCVDFLREVSKFKNIMTLNQQLSDLESSEFFRIIRDYFNTFEDESPSEKDIVCLQRMPRAIQEQLLMLIEKKGVCRHRARLAMAIGQYVGVPVRIIDNDLHTYAEVWYSGRLQRMDLGGGDATLLDRLEPKKPRVSRNNPTIPTVPHDPEREHYAALFRPAHHEIIETNKDTQSLLTWVVEQPRLLIRTDNLQQGRALYEALYPIAHAASPGVVFYIESKQDLLDFMQTMVVRDKQFKLNSMLEKYPDAHLMINWSGFSPADVANYKSLFDDFPTIDNVPIPVSIRTTNFMHKGDACSSFSSRFSQPHQKLPWPQGDQYTLPKVSEQVCDEVKSEKIDVYSSAWESIVLDHPGVAHHEFSWIDGALARALKAGNKEFILCGFPENCEKFKAFWSRLTTESRFLHNDEWLVIPKDFVFKLEEAPADPTLEEKELSEDVEEKKDDVPSVAETSLTSPMLEKLNSFLAFLSKVPHDGRGTPKALRESYARFEKSLIALSAKSDRSNPLKPFYLYDYDKNSENYAFINVMAKLLFASNEPDEKEPIRLYKLEKLITRFKGKPQEIWQWQVANCCSGRKLRELFGITQDTEIHGILQEQTQSVENSNLEEYVEQYGKLPKMADSSFEKLCTYCGESLDSASAEGIIEKKKKSPFEKSIRRMEEALDAYNMVVLKGPPGSGKSHAAKMYANAPGRKCYWGPGAIEAWRAHNDPTIAPVLVIDEVSLEKEGSLDTIFPIPTEQHKVICTDNPASCSVTRKLDALVQDQVTVYFNEWSHKECIDKVLMPLANNILDGASEDQRQAICEALLSAYDIAKNHASESAVSTRDLQQMLLRLKYRLKSEVSLWPTILMTVISDEWRHLLVQDKDQFKSDLFEYFSNNYDRTEVLDRGAFSNYFDGYQQAASTSKEAIAEYLEEYDFISYAENPMVHRVVAALISKGHYIPKHRERDIALLVEDIMLQKMKSELSKDRFDAASIGKTGLLIEGPSGIGKSAVLREILFELGIDFDQFTVGNPQTAEAGFTSAFHAGKTVIADELDIGVGLESALNQLITGNTKDGKKADNPGFFVCATQNGVGYSGRWKLSDAAKNRMHVLEFTDYTPLEMEEMAVQAGLSDVSAEKFVQEYVKARDRDPEDLNARVFLTVLREEVARQKGLSLAKPVMQSVIAKKANDVFTFEQQVSSKPVLSAQKSLPEMKKTASTCRYAAGSADFLFQQSQFDYLGNGEYAVNTEVPGQLVDGSVTEIILHGPNNGVGRHITDMAGTGLKMYKTKQGDAKSCTLDSIVEKIQLKKSGAMLIQSTDPVFIRGELEKQLPGCLSVTISEKSQWNTLFENSDSISKDPLRFHYTLQPVLEALLAGKDVVLSGHLPERLAIALMSLFDPTDPYLTLNGECVSIPGRLFFAVHQLTYPNPFSFAREGMYRMDALELRPCYAQFFPVHHPSCAQDFTAQHASPAQNVLPANYELLVV